MRTFFLSFFCVFSLNSSIYAQQDTSSINRGRLAITGGSALAVLGGSYAYIQNSWWSDQSSSFHFDDGSDLRYAKNIDKGGHFFGGILVADLFQSSLKWSGVNEKKSYLYGAAMGSFIQLSIELKDAYAPNWGFSVWDFGAGTIGAFVPYFEKYAPIAEFVDFKFSYYKRSNTYWELGTIQKPYAPPHKHAYQDDYVNQTYWLSLYPLKKRGIDLGIAIGFGLDDSQYLVANTKVGGKNEIYIALDYDMLQVLKKWDSPRAKKWKHWLNYIKLPAPTIRISPELEFYPFFM
jgi:VanZ family protein